MWVTRKQRGIECSECRKKKVINMAYERDVGEEREQERSR